MLPVRIPEIEPIVAFPLLQLQVPPVSRSLKVVVPLIHTVIIPPIAGGTVFTVIMVVVIQPAVDVKVIIDVPAEIPDTVPVVEPIVILPLLLLHVPVLASVKVVGIPIVTTLEPEIDPGNGLTVTIVVYIVDGLQPLPIALTDNEYVVVTVGTSVGFCKVDVKPSDPTHDHAVALVELENNEAVNPLHIAPSLVAPVENGTGLTETVVV